MYKKIDKNSRKPKRKKPPEVWKCWINQTIYGLGANMLRKSSCFMPFVTPVFEEVLVTRRLRPETRNPLSGVFVMAHSFFVSTMTGNESYEC